ncbi:MAG: hypothetical protein Tsb0016_03870 [Sphingomonadales bacterium]
MSKTRTWLLIVDRWPAGDRPHERLLASLAREHGEAVSVLAVNGAPASAPFPVEHLPISDQAGLLRGIMTACRRHGAGIILIDERIGLTWPVTVLRRLCGKKLVFIGDKPAAGRPAGAPTPYLDFSNAAHAEINGQDWRARAQAVARTLAYLGADGAVHPDMRLTGGAIARPASTRHWRQPLLTVIVDTEEEFDWAAPVSSHQTQVFATQEIWRFQEMCEAANVRPTYVLDYPVAAQDHSARIFRQLSEQGRAEIGAHLHGWVTPPYDSIAANIDSYQGNLDSMVEAAKLKTLTQTIETQVGVRPVIHKAGRYGIGASTAANLRQLGYQIDLSPSSGFDFRGDGGPDFTAYSAQPFWFGDDEALICLPTSGAVIGKTRLWHRFLSAQGALDDQEFFVRFSPLSLLAERVRLSPEGNSLKCLRMLTDALIGQGVKALTLSLHSTSLAPHANPYAKDEADVRRMLDICADYFRYFRERHDGAIITPQAMRDRLATAPAPAG